MQIDSTGKAGAITGTSDIGLDAGLHLRPRRRSAWNLPVLEEKHRWCCQRDSNTRPHPYQGCALPLELWQHCHRRA